MPQQGGNPGATRAPARIVSLVEKDEAGRLRRGPLEKAQGVGGKPGQGAFGDGFPLAEAHPLACEFGAKDQLLGQGAAEHLQAGHGDQDPRVGRDHRLVFGRGLEGTSGRAVGFDENPVEQPGLLENAYGLGLETLELVAVDKVAGSGGEVPFLPLPGGHLHEDRRRVGVDQHRPGLVGGGDEDLGGGRGQDPFPGCSELPSQMEHDARLAPSPGQTEDPAGLGEENLIKRVHEGLTGCGGLTWLRGSAGRPCRRRSRRAA